MKLVEFLEKINNSDWSEAWEIWGEAVEASKKKGVTDTINNINDWIEVWPALEDLVKFIKAGIFDDLPYVDAGCRIKAYPVGMCALCPRVAILYNHRYFCENKEILKPFEIPDWCLLKDYEGDE